MGIKKAQVWKETNEKVKTDPDRSFLPGAAERAIFSAGDEEFNFLSLCFFFFPHHTVSMGKKGWVGCWASSKKGTVGCMLYIICEI